MKPSEYLKMPYTNEKGSFQKIISGIELKELDKRFIDREELLIWLKEELEEVEAENIRYGKKNIKDKLCDGASYALRDVIAKVISNSIEEFVDNRNKSKKEILELLK